MTTTVAREVELAELRAQLAAKDAELAAMRAENTALHYRGEHDTLTALCNRAGIASWINAAVKSGTDHVTVCVMDLDGFKAVNDSKGHAAGDELLVTVAHALDVVAFEHCGIAARTGGDEFVMIFPDDQTETAGAIVEGIDGASDVSIGITFGETITWADLLQFADVALYHSKKKPGSAYTVWVPGLGMPDPRAATNRRANR